VGDAMKVRDCTEDRDRPSEGPGDKEQGDQAPLLPLILGRSVQVPANDSASGVLVGELVGMMDGEIPLVTWPGRVHSVAVVARAVVDLAGSHIGKQVVLMFEAGDFSKPIIMGVLRGGHGWPLHHQPAHVEVEADGERLTVTAANKLVLRCGKASLTLTQAGKVLLQGTYVMSRSSGVNRIEGGSVQIN
jgi:hypothetical protein